MSHLKLLCVSAAMAFAQANASAGTSTDATFTSGLGSMVYRVYYPDNYQASGPNKTPVVLYLHSAAERGDSVAQIFGGGGWTNPWINNLINETQHGTHQAVLVMPQSGAWQSWNSMTDGDNWGVGSYTNATAKPINPRLQLAVNVLDTVVAGSNVNTNKVYVTGPSMGGYGTWDVIGRFPNKFAAAAPAAGGGNTDLARTVMGPTPIWSFHGATDNLVPASGTANMYFAHKQGGGNSTISYIAGVGHDGFDKFYQPGYYTTDKPQATGGSGQNLYDWMFSKDLSTNAGGTPIAPGQAKVIIGFGGGSTGNDRAGYTANGAHFVAYNYVEAGNITNLHDANNAPTGFSITRSGGSIGAGGGTTSLGPVLGDALPLPFNHALFTPSAQQMTFTISGLDPQQDYRVDILGTADAPDGVHSITRYQLAGEIAGTQQIDVVNNKTFVTFDAFSPTASGQFILSVSGVGSDYGYLSDLVITPLPIPEPTSLAVAFVAGLGLLRRRRAGATR